jgi:hypothetical protein
MNTLYSYLKVIEQKLSAPEAPEIQFLNTEIYKNEEFNLKSLTLSIMEKIKDTSYLLNQLKLTLEKTKNEIFEQINSNYNNYVALISKLQTLDFLVDNIQQSFQKIKNKIENKSNLVEKYEKEFTEMLNFIKENDKEILKVKKALKEYDINMKASKVKEKIEKIILISSSNLRERQYTATRQLLFLFIDYFELVGEDENKYFNYFNLIEEILYHFTEDYFIKQNNSEINLKLDLNIINLIFKIYKYTKKEDILFKKLFNGFIKSTFNRITDTNKNVLKIINELINYINSERIQKLANIFKNDNFNKICFFNPFINKFIKEKFIFNCSDVNQFVTNYLSILKFIKIFNLKENDDLNTIRNFLQNFSFFTYYQYLQNDLCIKLIDLIENKSLDNDYILLITNTLFNFTKAIKDILNENKIFLKILPNFLNFISQCSILIYSKIEEANKLIKNSKNIKPNLINDFKKNVALFIEYFKQNGEFHSNIVNIVFENEKFLIKNEEQKQEFQKLLLTLLSSLNNLNKK